MYLRPVDASLYPREGKDQMSESTPPSASQGPSIATLSPQTWLWWMRRQSPGSVASQTGACSADAPPESGERADTLSTRSSA
jgi:hypothetical protein